VIQEISAPFVSAQLRPRILPRSQAQLRHHRAVKITSSSQIYSQGIAPTLVILVAISRIEYVERDFTVLCEQQQCSSFSLHSLDLEQLNSFDKSLIRHFIPI